jgi:stage V sporulation protein AA
MGSIMGIMNFHADVNMAHSQFMMVDAITDNPKAYMPYFQLPYSIGIGIGVALFFNKFIPTYSKGEPSPLDLKMISLDAEIQNQLRKK